MDAPRVGPDQSDLGRLAAPLPSDRPVFDVRAPGTPTSGPGDDDEPLPPPPPPPGGGAALEHRAYLKATSELFVDDFGAPIAFDGDTLVAGAPFMGVGYDSDGAVFVFARQGDTWSQEAMLFAPYGEQSDGIYFGTSIALQGDLLVVGAPRQGNGGVHVFERSGTVWTRTALLEPLFQQQDFECEFGQAVALDGDRLLIGAPGDSSASTGVGGDPTNQDAPLSGAAYVYVRDGAGWALEAYVKPSNTTANHGFGGAVGLSGDTLAVSSGDDSSATGVNGDQTNTDSPGSGAVFVFERGVAGWAQQAYVKASNTGAGDGFGSAFWPGHGFALSGDTLAVGAVWEDSAATGVDGDQASDDAPDSGAAYVFTRSGATWSQQAYLKASNTEPDDRFGSRVALGGSRLAVSAPYEDSGATEIDGDQADDTESEAGAAYLYEQACGGWAQTHYVKAFNSANGLFFGWAMAFNGPDLAVGAIRQYTCPEPDPDNDCLRRGAVYLLR